MQKIFIPVIFTGIYCFIIFIKIFVCQVGLDCLKYTENKKIYTTCSNRKSSPPCNQFIYLHQIYTIKKTMSVCLKFKVLVTTEPIGLNTSGNIPTGSVMVLI